MKCPVGLPGAGVEVHDLEVTQHLLLAQGVALAPCKEREFFIDNLLVRIRFIIVMIRWTGLAPWEFEFPFPGSLTSTFLAPCNSQPPDTPSPFKTQSMVIAQ